MKFHICQRCGDSAYEALKSYAHCINCNYSPEFEAKVDPPIPSWVQKFVDDPKDKVSTLINTVENTNLSSFRGQSPKVA